MKNIKWILLALLFVGVFSCKKKETTSVKVTIIDSDLNRVVPNWKVYLYETRKKSVLTFSHGIQDEYVSNDLWDGSTDANGQKDFGEFNVYKNGKYDYSVGAAIAPNFEVGYSKGIEKGTNNNITLEITERSRLTVHVTPRPPSGNVDTFRLDLYGINNNFHLFVTNNDYEAGNFAVDLVTDTYRFNIDKFKSGVYTNIKDTLFYDINSNYEYNVNW